MKAQDLWYCSWCCCSFLLYPRELTSKSVSLNRYRDEHVARRINVPQLCCNHRASSPHARVSEQLASGKNPSGIPLKDAFFSVSLTNFPATITVRAGDDSSNILNDSEQVEGQPDDAFREFEQTTVAIF